MISGYNRGCVIPFRPGAKYMADNGNRFQSNVPRMTRIIPVILAVAVVCVVIAAFWSSSFFTIAPDKNSVGAEMPARVVYPIPPHRDMLLDGLAASTPAATPVPLPVPVPEPQAVSQKQTLPAAAMGAGKQAVQVGGQLAGTLRLSSPQVFDGRLSIEHTCYRSNRAPGLLWTGVPPNAKSLVVFFEKDDGLEDNPLHWIVYNIPATSTGLAARMPVGAVLEDGTMQGVGEGGRVGYTGPCIPKGRHDYQFRIFALDTLLDMPAGAHKYDIIDRMNGHIVDAYTYKVYHYYQM